MKELKLHPLLTKSSDGKLKNSHYDSGSEPTIMKIERELTVYQMAAACTFNIRKYNDRTKGSDEQDETKAIAYQRYLDFLKSCMETGSNTIVATYMQENGIEFNYA